MKKNILFGFAACGAMLLSANVAKAQEAVVIEEATFTEVADCTDQYYSEKGSNWFIQLGAGMELPMVDCYKAGPKGQNDGKRGITAAYGVDIGNSINQ